MLRRLAVLAMVLLPSLASAQVIRYIAPGGTFTGGAITSPILAPAANNCASVPYSFTGDTNTGLCSSAGDTAWIYAGGQPMIRATSTEVYMPYPLLVSNIYSPSQNTKLVFDDAANTLALRNGTNAQTFNWYYSYTDGSNYHRGALKTSSTGIEIAAETAGSGADNLDVTITPAGTGGVKVTSGAGLSVGGAAVIADYFSAPTGTGYYIGSRGFVQGGDTAGELAAVSSSGSANATWRFSRQVEVNTTTKAPGALENGEIYTNTGDADGSTVTLLNDPAIGSQYCVIVDAAQTVTVAPSAGETIVQAGTAYSTSCTNNVPGSTACFVAGTGGSGARWFFLSVVGTWTCS